MYAPTILTSTLLLLPAVLAAPTSSTASSSNATAEITPRTANDWFVTFYDAVKCGGRKVASYSDNAPLGCTNTGATAALLSMKGEESVAKDGLFKVTGYFGTDCTGEGSVVDSNGECWWSTGNSHFQSFKVEKR